MMRDVIRKFTPVFVLEFYRRYKKSKRNRELSKQKNNDQSLTLEDLLKDLDRLGIKCGEDILVHSSLSSIGHISGGTDTLITALLTAIGETGNLLMPTSPNPSYQFEYALSNPVFDVETTPSQMGKLTESFRRCTGVRRSLHPTEPVSCIGPLAEWYVGEHHLHNLPYGKHSPFYRLTERKGKILLIGVTLTSCTNLHVLEDAIEDFHLPVYKKEPYVFRVYNYHGKLMEIETMVHSPEQSKKRRCDELISFFETKGVLKRGKLGQANVLVLESKGMLECMIKAYKEYGVTMYTPFGRK